MRIAINALAMRDQLYGVGNYIKHLLWSLAAFDNSNEYLLFVSKNNMRHMANLGDKFRYRFAPTHRPLRILWEQTVLPGELRRERIDVFHGPTFITPLRKECAYVVSVLDMTFYLTGDQHTLPKRLYFGKLIPHVIRRSDAVIAISESTKRDIVLLLGIPEEKIAVIHLGVDSRFGPITDARLLSAVRQKYCLPERFILFVGVIEPRKNLLMLIEAYERSRVMQDNVHLVLAGALGWSYQPLLRKIAASSVRRFIHLPGYVADVDLPALYNLASLFVYPSFYEGFGLPVLEAMACGKPVIASNVSSLPEIVGAAGVLVDPSSPAALAEAMQEVLANKQLQQSLSERARKRAQAFTWESVAKKTLAVYEAVARRY